METIPLNDLLRDDADVTQLEPDYHLIEFIHRDPDAWIAFCTKHDDQFRGLLSCQMGDLAVMFPEMRRELVKDSFFGLNGMFRPAKYESRRAPGYKAAYRESRGVRRLTCCFADLDVYKLGLTFGEAVGAVIDAQDGGVIPPASILVRSGRGIWLLWLLYDEKEPDLPTRAWPEIEEAWGRVQSEIGRRLAHIGADAQARDAARVTRIPGSTHTGSGRQVQYFIQADATGEGYRYTLSELCDYFRVDPPKRKQPRPGGRGEGNNVFSLRARKANQAMRQYRVRQVEMLRDLRGGFREGHPSRNSAVMIYAYCLEYARVPEAELLRRVEALAESCVPPLSGRETFGAIRKGRSLGVEVTNQKIADLLDITPKERDQMRQELGKAATLPFASRFKERQDDALEDVAIVEAEERPRTKAERRQEFIRTFIATKMGGVVPSVREMTGILQDEGFDVKRSSVGGDYKAMGLRSGCGPTVQPELFSDK